MRPWILRLASLKLAFALLVVLGVALACGTIVEARAGTELAARHVYGAWWFRLLLAAFALNVACSILLRWPFGRERLGFVLTHGALLVILAGALITEAYKVEGRLALWEGERASAFSTEDGRSLPLPFTIELGAFEIDTYPGTSRPAMFRSRVTVVDARSGASFPAAIEMNRELAYGGYRLFQSSYERASGRDRTILTVSRDPGQPVVFAGYFLLLAGMVTVLCTRILQSRAGSLPDAHEAARIVRRAAAAGLVALSGAGAALAAEPLADRATVEILRRLPVQHDGRVLPLDTLAREAVWNVTGRTRPGADPVALVLGWTFSRDAFAREPMIRVSSAISSTCALAARASWTELLESECLRRLAQEARAEEEAGRPLPGILAEAAALQQRLLWVHGFFVKTSYRLIPPPGDPNAEWSVPPRLASPTDLFPFVDHPSSAAPSREAIEREILYNRVRPTRVAFAILTLAAALSIAAWNVPRRWLDLAALVSLAAGFAAMTWGIGTRWQIAGRIPAANMYESLLFLGWGVGLFAVAAFVLSRNRLVMLNAAIMSALTMALADLLPIDPFVHPVPPVLAGTAWLAIHVPIIMLSYSVLALGVLVAHVQIGLEIFAPGRRQLRERTSDLLYWYVHVGSILLIAGILTGSMWASSSWGRYWGWDPKEVWSLCAFLAYVAILHGRVDRWLGTFGVAALSIVAFWTILMTYVGVNFVLASGLHSYGFGGTSVTRWMGAVAGLEVLFLVAGCAVRLGGSRSRELAAR